MRLPTFPLGFIVLFLHSLLIIKAENTETAEEVAVHDFFNRNVPAATSESSHTNNWAVLVCASRYWFNYRVSPVRLLHASCT